MTDFHVYNCISFTKFPGEVTASATLLWMPDNFSLATEDKLLFAARVM